MQYEDWFKKFTHLFLAIKFPNDWHCAKLVGRWDNDSGGNRMMLSWMANPKFEIALGKGTDPTDPEGCVKRTSLLLLLVLLLLLLGERYGCARHDDRAPDALPLFPTLPPTRYHYSPHSRRRATTTPHTTAALLLPQYCSPTHNSFSASLSGTRAST